MKLFNAIIKLLNPSGALCHLQFTLISLLFVDILSPNIVLILSICFLVNLFSYGINNTFDVDTDSKNIKKRNRNPFVLNEIKRSQAIIVLFFILFLGITLSFFFFGVFTYYLLLGITFSILYSTPPFRFKGKFVLDMLFHGLTAVSFLLFSFFILQVNQNYLLPSIIICLLISTLFNLENELEDYNADRNANLKTTVATIGKKFSFLIFLTLFTILYLFSVVILAEKINVLILIVGFMMFLILSIKPTRGFLKTNNISISQVHKLYYPLYIISSIIIILNLINTIF
jgi:4-hydroxybenzoate polyprenyltransferase